MKDVTATEAALRNAGFPVTLTIINGHDHSYTDVAPSVNRAAWEFFEPLGLSSRPYSHPMSSASHEPNPRTVAVGPVRHL